MSAISRGRCRSRELCSARRTNFLVFGAGIQSQCQQPGYLRYARWRSARSQEGIGFVHPCAISLFSLRLSLLRGPEAEGVGILEDEVEAAANRAPFVLEDSRGGVDCGGDAVLTSGVPTDDAVFELGRTV